MKIIAIIPAAGKGTRFGMPKVDASYNGISFAEMIKNTLTEAGISAIYLIRDVETPDMLATIKTGMQRALREQERPDGWLIWPVDHPTVKAGTIQMLVSVFAAKANSVIIPRHQNQNGHPILIPGALVIPDQTEPLGLKGVILKSGFPQHYIDVDDVGILFNFNTPEDVIYV
ncbi:MAG: NTP transferase domain-containing protein [Candidatus Cloacimonadaceae bacterium]